jgi:predicted ArsR family transcriptional regulator
MSSHETLPAHDADSDEATTRDRVARSILEQGPSTAAELAERLALTPAAVRRHLAALIDSGHLEARDQRVYGQRGRGRPAKVFCLTDAGRSDFYQAYDRLAISALEFLRFGWHDKDAAGASARRGLNEDVVRDISGRKDEPEWMLSAACAG